MLHRRAWYEGGEGRVEKRKKKMEVAHSIIGFLRNEKGFLALSSLLARPPAGSVM